MRERKEGNLRRQEKLRKWDAGQKREHPNDRVWALEIRRE